MTRPLGSMEMRTFEALVDTLAPTTLYLQLFFQGEPFLHRNLMQMVRYAHTRNMYVAISTNAHFIRNGMAEEIVETGLERLIVSLDGVTEESYREYRIGGDLSAVLEALDGLKKARQISRARTEVVLQFLVTRQNETELPRLRQLAGEYDAGVAVKTIQVYSIEGAKQFLPLDERYRRYHYDGRILLPKSRMANRCVHLWERGIVTWDGTVVPCCFDKDAQHPLGNVTQSDFADIWRSSKSHAFRERILRNRKGVEICGNCTEGLKIYR